MTTKVASSELPTPWGVFAIHAFDDDATGKEHVALTMGNVAGGEPVLLRIHSECLTGDALFSRRCDCGSQLEYAMRKIATEKRGAILYLRQEGRGIGLANKIKAYELQDQGADTVEANEQLGFGADMRDYSLCGDMLKTLGITQVRLLTNNPRKIDALKTLGINIVERLPIETGRNPHNAHYLKTKAGKLGHFIKPATPHE